MQLTSPQADKKPSCGVCVYIGYWAIPSDGLKRRNIGAIRIIAQGRIRTFPGRGTRQSIVRGDGRDRFCER